MNELQVFNNSEFGELRTVTIDSEPWFVGKDVATALGYERATKAVQDHVDNEDIDDVPIQDPIGRMQKTLIINESGLYSLILSSKLPTAKRFKRWVTAEVLPTLRKTGSYSLIPIDSVNNVEPAVPQRVLTTDDYLKAAAIVSTCRNERLPYVLHYLTAGGFDEPRLANTVVGDEPVRAVRLMKEAHERGLSLTQIGKITGLDKMQISRYTKGQTFPRGGRAVYLVEVMERALADM